MMKRYGLHLAAVIGLAVCGLMFKEQLLYALAPKDRAATLYREGALAQQTGHADLAKEKFEEARELDPENPEVLFSLAYIYEQEGRLRDARGLYIEAAEKDPENPEIPFNLGNVYAALGQKNEAIAAYLKAVQLNPNHMNANINLSVLYYRDGHYADALRYLEEAELSGYVPPVEYKEGLKALIKEAQVDKAGNLQ